jgi:predicted lipoprotein with Yx(FWY)xxD motif
MGGAIVRTIRVVTLAPIALALVVAGCGSSGKTSTSPAAGGGAYGRSTTSAASTATPAALITTKHAGKLGTVLASGSKRLTVYLFEADKPGSSSCMGACTSVWPPVTGSPKALGNAMSADLGTTTRPDGTKQVTYKGHPLYRYVKDKDNGDTYGEGIKSFGAGWYALSPSGNKIDLS